MEQGVLYTAFGIHYYTIMEQFAQTLHGLTIWNSLTLCNKHEGLVPEIVKPNNYCIRIVHVLM